MSDLERDRLSEVAAMQHHTVLETVVGDIACGDGKRVLGDVDRIDFCVRKRTAGQNGKAAGAGAELEHVFHRVRVGDQGRSLAILSAEMRIQQFDGVRGVQ